MIDMRSTSSLSLQSFSGSNSKLMTFDQFTEHFKQPKLIYQHASDVVQVFQYTENTPASPSCLVFVHHGTLLQTGRLFKKLIDNNKLMPNVIPYDEAYKDEEEYDATYYLICRDSNVMNTYQSQQLKTLEDVFTDVNSVNLLNDFGFVKHILLDVANGLRQLHRSELTHNNLYLHSVLLVNNRSYDGTSKYQAKRAILQFPGIGISYILHVGIDFNYAPEVTHHTEFSKENDVYMFGLLILKMLTMRDINPHSENFEWKVDVQEKVTARFGAKASSTFIRSLLTIAKDCILSPFRPSSDHLVSRLNSLSERDEPSKQHKVHVEEELEEYHDSFASLGNGESHYFHSGVDQPHLSGDGEDFQLHNFESVPQVVIDMDEDDEESETLSAEMFDRRKSSRHSSINISMKDPLNDKQANSSHNDDENVSKPKGIRKLFACFLCGGRDSLDNDSNRIDLYATPAIDQAQQDALPDYLLEGKKKRETLFCERLLKRNACGSIILVKDERTRHNMAMKKCTLGNEELYEREIKVLKQMNNRYISKYIDSFDYTDEDHITDHISKHIVLQYYPTGDLIECFLRKKPRIVLTPVLFTKILCQCFEGLIYLSENGWVHGNITPGNILLDENLNIVFSDFAFCLRKDEKIQFVVKSDYSAPEYKTSSMANPLSDVFSVGSVMTQLLLYHKIDIKTLKTQNMTLIDALRVVLGNDSYSNKFSPLLNHPKLEKNIGEILRDATALDVQNRRAASLIYKDCVTLKEQVAAICIQKFLRGYKVRKQYKDKLPKRERKPSTIQTRREARRIKASQSNYAISSITKSGTSSYGSGITRSSTISTDISRNLNPSLSRSTSNYDGINKSHFVL